MVSTSIGNPVLWCGYPSRVWFIRLSWASGGQESSIREKWVKIASTSTYDRYVTCNEERLDLPED